MTDLNQNSPLPQDERSAFESAYAAEFSNARVQVYTAKDIASMREGDSYGERPYLNGHWKGWQARAALAQPSPAGEFSDAYQGAREDLAIWKRRALEAEQALREEKILTERLGNALNDENGPTFMGEPKVEQPSPAPELERPDAVAWGAFYFGGKHAGKLYAHCNTESEVDAYILDIHRSSDSLTLRKGALYAAPVAPVAPLAPLAQDGQVPDGFALVPDHPSADAIVTALYRRFKDWSSRGFGPEDVTWCEVKADLLALVTQAGQVPEGYALIPTRLLLDKELIECIAFHCGDGGGSYGDYQNGILFIGEITDDDGRQVHGLHLACAECEEEGYTTLVEFAAAPAQVGE